MKALDGYELYRLILRGSATPFMSTAAPTPSSSEATEPESIADYKSPFKSATPKHGDDGGGTSQVC